jgi:DNA helicase IV
LHRAAYLLYHHRQLLESRGVLLIGPSTSFLRYIDHVLPSLGETGAVSTTLGGLVRGIDTSTHEREEVARIKGRTDMAHVVRAAVRERQRLPRADQEILIDGRAVVIRRTDVRDAQSKARRDGKPHNEARAAFAKEMISRLTAQLMAQLEASLGDDDRHELARDVRDNRTVRVAINLCWLPITPEHLLRDLFSKDHLLDACASMLTPHERALLRRAPDAPFTDADVPLLDEAAELLGELPSTGPKVKSGPSAEEVQYAREVLRTFGGSSMIPVDAETLAARMQAPTARLSVAERAVADRSWTYGHIVVDEAQELSPMAWRMLLRRCPTRSFTIVGDVAQTTATAGTRWWPETMDPLFREGWQLRELTVSYRIPAAVAEAAQSFARAAGLPVSEMSAARELDNAVVAVRVSGDVLEHAVAEAVRQAERYAQEGGGLVAVITSDASADAARLAAAGTTVQVLSARESKGLEFDAVVLAEPAQIAAVPSDLYVALTRPTRRLTMVHAQDLPAGLAGA